MELLRLGNACFAGSRVAVPKWILRMDAHSLKIVAASLTFFGFASSSAG